MARTSIVGAAMLVGIIGAGAQPAGAQAVREAKDSEVTFRVTRDKAGPQLVVSGRGVRVTKRVTPQMVSIRVEAQGDTVQLETDMSGVATLRRNGKARRLLMSTPDGERAAQARQITTGSRAMSAFDTLALSLSRSERPEARSLLTSYALMHAVSGTLAPVPPLAGGAPPLAPREGVQFVKAMSRENPQACWAEYAYSVERYLTEFQTCIEDWWWNPYVKTACTFEWAIKSELAWFWVITCSGGMPV